jgi:6-phosphogluconolactonase
VEREAKEPVGRVSVLADPESHSRAAAERMAATLSEAVDAHDRCDLALAGGTTPKRAYELLAGRRLPWSRVHVWFGDERCVPPDHPESNYALARESLLDRVAIPAANVHRMEAERRDRDAAARDYERQLPEELDLLLLGIGPDGHTASLFPGHPAVEEERRRVVHVVAPKPPPERLTITPPVIRAARETLVLVSGSDKAAAVAHALEGDVEYEKCPARLLRGATWLIDRAAARDLVRIPGAPRP